MINWKSIEKDGMPEKSGMYLVCDSKGWAAVLAYSAKYRLWNCYDHFSTEEEAKSYAIPDITHWAEINLPDAP